MTERRTFPNASSSVTAARRFVTSTVSGAPRPVAEAVAIVVSELATNCVRHAGTDFTIDIDQTPDELRVTVADSGEGWPTVRSPRPSEPSGRGLLLVRALADDWGIDAARDHTGKSVWFTMRLSARRDGAFEDADTA
jgi:anti-sigma regulatory factor (Ser/Thr protein kinase)